MQCADLAMYAAKNHIRLHFQWFQPYMRTMLDDRVELTQALREAIKQKQFVMHYQPKVDVNTHEIKGFEALVRWNHPNKGLIYPDEFIPLAEDTGHILALGELIMQLVCQDIQKWKSHQLAIVPIAINLSVSQFNDPDVANVLISTLESNDILAKHIEIEITESVLANDPVEVAKTLKQINDYGCQISIDDFGTNQSSLSRLKDFEFKKIKIDKSFLKDLSINKKALALLKSIVSLGQALELEIIVEGVETQSELKAIKCAGCLEVQGFLFSKGVSAEKVENLLEQGRINPLQ